MEYGLKEYPGEYSATDCTSCKSEHPGEGQEEGLGVQPSRPKKIFRDNRNAPHNRHLNK